LRFPYQNMLPIDDPRDWPRWLLMWLLTGAIYFAFKVLTWSTTQTSHVPRWRQVAYLFAWPGMNAERFLTSDGQQQVSWPSANEWIRGAVNLVSGAVIFWTAKNWLPPSSPILLGWAGMIGTILMLHFGSFQLLSCLWRSAGFDAPPLMNRPTHSTSVAEFWGRRWNMAFRDLTYQFLFRPLRSRIGPVAALVVGFVISGVIHDIVISLPAGGGYGGPTAFFTIQAAAIFAERSRAGRALGLGHGWRGWLFTAIALLLPVRLLFHDAFVANVVVPFMKAFGA
jgi:hypothetical protein